MPSPGDFGHCIALFPVKRLPGPEGAPSKPAFCSPSCTKRREALYRQHRAGMSTLPWLKPGWGAMKSRQPPGFAGILAKKKL